MTRDKDALEEERQEFIKQRTIIELDVRDKTDRIKREREKSVSQFSIFLLSQSYRRHYL